MHIELGIAELDQVCLARGFFREVVAAEGIGAVELDRETGTVFVRGDVKAA